MVYIPRTLCRNDFAPALRFANELCEDTARDNREFWEAELAAAPIVLTAVEQANLAALEAKEFHYNRWQRQVSDYNSMGHSGYFAKYGTISPAPESYVPMVLA